MHRVSPPPETDFFVQFFGFQILWTTFVIVMVILGKDLLLDLPRSRILNVVLAIFCTVLLICGRVRFGAIEMAWGVVQ
jgi:hypothetical protein